jgi:hypothetical protein
MSGKPLRAVIDFVTPKSRRRIAPFKMTPHRRAAIMRAVHGDGHKSTAA